MSLPPVLSNIVNWLRAGYPNGVPEADYIPLLAVLTRRLSNDEVHDVAQALVDSGTLPTENVDIGVLITKLTDEMPREEDIERVREKLVSYGWPTTD